MSRRDIWGYRWIWRFPKKLGVLFGGLGLKVNNEAGMRKGFANFGVVCWGTGVQDYSILGSMLGSPHLGKLYT